MKNTYETECNFGKCSIGFDSKAEQIFIKADDYSARFHVSPNDIKNITEMFDKILVDLRAHIAKIQDSYRED